MCRHRKDNVKVGNKQISQREKILYMNDGGFSNIKVLLIKSRMDVVQVYQNLNNKLCSIKICFAFGTFISIFEPYPIIHQQLVVLLQ